MVELPNLVRDMPAVVETWWGAETTDITLLEGGMNSATAALTLPCGRFIAKWVPAPIAGFASFLLQRRRAYEPNRDETLRAGSPDEVDSHAAALKAGGTTAWMRPGGGGF